MLIDGKEDFVREFGEGAKITVDGGIHFGIKSFDTETLECTKYITGDTSEENLPDDAYRIGAFAVRDFKAREIVVRNSAGDVIFSSSGG